MHFGTRSLGSAVRSALGPGIVAGLTGGVFIDAYLLATVVGLGHAATVTSFYQFVAAGAIGTAAAFNGGMGAALLGLALHLMVSAAWGVGYAYLATTTPQLHARPILSGIAFGIGVMLAMQLVEVAAGIFRFPGPGGWFNALVAHAIFFGLPVALVVARTQRTP